MTAVDILAWIVIVIILAKFTALFLFEPKKWYTFSQKVLKRSKLTTLIYLILAVIVGNYLFQEVTIIEFFASTLFLSLLIILSFLPRVDEYLKFADVVINQPASELRKQFGLIIIIWLALVIWAIIALLS